MYIGVISNLISDQCVLGSPGKHLGPTTVIDIYINSLPSQVTDGVTLQHADDTTLVCSGTSPLAPAEVMNQQ